MNYEDLKDYNFSVFKGYGDNRTEVKGELMDRALDLIDTAIDKQIPKPMVSHPESASGFDCPRCGHYVFRDEEYCSWCGQKLISDSSHSSWDKWEKDIEDSAKDLFKDPVISPSEENEDIVLAGLYPETFTKYH